MVIGHVVDLVNWWDPSHILNPTHQNEVIIYQQINLHYIFPQKNKK